MIEIPDIIVAVENKDHFILDDFVRSGEFEKLPDGQLKRYVGGFTAVFPVLVNGEKWAFRCWYADMGNVRRRFETIAKAISNSNAKYLCNFVYTDEGVVVKGKHYPTTRMRWVEGQTIKDYICTNANDINKLHILAKRFLIMVQDMHRHGFAHGDLQHGNIIINNQGEPFLVDYDSFYCPELKGESDIITGLADYQHPARKNNVQINEKIDYFSELVIYTSILAIAANPNLTQKYKVADSDRMLFAAQDYLSFHESEIYKNLLGLTPEIDQLLSIFDTYLSATDIATLEPFDVLLDRMNISLTLSKSKISLGNDSATLSWNVKKGKTIILYENDKVLQEKISKHGSLSVSPTATTKYKLQVVGSQGKYIESEVVLNVFEEAKVSFTSDKQYVFQKIPFTLSWEVANAKRVELEGEKVECKGKKTFVDGIEASTTFMLKVVDEFGTKTYKVEIKLLPLPQIKSLLVPTPKIENTLSITVQQPRIDAEVKFPQINMSFADADIPFVPSLSDLGLNVELSLLTPKFNLLSSVKRVFNHIVKRWKNKKN